MPAARTRPPRPARRGPPPSPWRWRAPRLEPADRILATILYQRKAFTQALLADLFAVDRSRIARAVAETRKLLNQHGHATPTTTARFHTRPTSRPTSPTLRTHRQTRSNQRVNHLQALGADRPPAAAHCPSRDTKRRCPGRSC
ncbi:transposase family protein [Catellatospora methionotrophica]|uniref:transposase family protein n=1 Tax=Catellatospora methionotrophica TaxID=121620 RepID=UPI0033D89067